MHCQIMEDYITGKVVPNTGAEEQRQAVEKYLVEEKGYPREAIRVDFPMTLQLGEEVHRTKLNLLVFAGDLPLMVLKCVAGSLDSWVRETVAAARVLTPSHQLPFAVVSDGSTALVYDGISGKILGEGLRAIPSWELLSRWPGENALTPLPPDRILRQGLVFRTYDLLNIEAHSCGEKR
ncbi:type I restriction enzyme HsdR N-terminal domain-containing protein [Desulfococcaceae bacterium OttesenSCG-928-F15]|nr:type I restriction enzyme HsdR N-terminal domain-containing protein [Desulfococcaceae bacterium OttesenSCG-928-F15]